jgi:membrane protein
MWQGLWQALESRLYSPGAEGSRPLARLRRSLRPPVAVLRDLAGGDINLRAMGLVYTTVLALIPAVALSFVVLRAFGLHRGLEPLLLEFFSPVGSGAQDLTRRVMRFADTVRTGLVGSIGLLLLLATLMDTVRKVEDAFNFVWRVAKPRGLARRLAEYAGLLLAGPVVVVGVIAFSTLALDSANSLAVQEAPLLVRVTQLAIRLAPYAIVTLLFWALYVVIPNTRVRPGPSLVGALSAGVLWAAAGKLFTAVVVYTSRFTLIYAGFALGGAFLLWTYLGWLILLSGARLAFYLQNPAWLRLGLRQLQLSALEQERLGLAILLHIGAHSRPVSFDSLCQSLDAPGSAVSDTLTRLARDGLIQGAEEGLPALARPAETITVQEALSALRRPLADRAPLCTPPPAAVADIEHRLAAAWGQAVGSRTLRDCLADLRR